MGSRYTHSGRISDVTYYQSIEENPYYHFWSTSSLRKTLQSAAASKRKTAFLFENGFPYEKRAALMEITTFDPKARIETIEDKEGRIIGFQYLLPERSEEN